MKLNTPHGHRQLSFPLVYNARDLGGLHNAHGQETRWKSFVRCDSPFRLNDEGLRLVHDYGIRTVIDLRHDEELAREPNPLREHPGIQYVNVPFIDPRNLSVLVNTIETEGMLAWNLKMLEVARPEISAAFRAIANAPEGGVLFHCYAGKDRTGLTALLQLTSRGLFGALRELIEREFAHDFDGVDWAVTPEAAVAAKHLSESQAEVIFHAAREAIRNAARYGRGPQRHLLRLTVGSTLSQPGQLRLWIEDDGVGAGHGAPSLGSGNGLALHNAMLAVIGGTLTSAHGVTSGTRITLECSTTIKSSAI